MARAKTIVTALAALVMVLGMFAAPAIAQETSTNADGYPVEVDHDDVVDDDVVDDDVVDQDGDEEDGEAVGGGDGPTGGEGTEVLGLAIGGTELAVYLALAAAVLLAGAALVMTARRRRGVVQ